MSTAESIAQLVDVLSQFKPGAPLKGYIAYARFPRFKNLEPGTRIDFKFPLTALVGANGIGKSSVLHAMWGMPKGYSTSKYWFSTELDPIAGTNRNPQQYIYGHWNESYKGIVETRKARVGKKKDYWEPAKPTKSEGMEPVPDSDFEGKSADRWNPVERDVVYINMKAIFGSFDRFFYFDDGINEARRRGMRGEASRLKRIVDGDLKSFFLRGKERVRENRLLTAQELTAVSEILGRTYKSARLVKHSLYPGFRSHDTSVVFERGAAYSEAFAGSGELAAVHAVVEILKAESHSLILLDEPETSLHPGAQRALLAFLLEQIKAKKHQIIISTHSFDFLQGLPDDAIKVFEPNGNDQARVISNCSAYVALHRLGVLPPNKIRILVEDELAQLIVLRAADGLDPGESKAIEVRIMPGGAESILAHSGPAAMATGDTVYVLLDGDKRRVDAFTDPDQIPPAKHSELGTVLLAEIGCDPNFLLAGGNDKAGKANAEVKARLQYLGWLRQHVSYLPQLCPEKIVLDHINPEAAQGLATAKQAKDALRAFLAPNIELNNAELTTLQKVKVANIPLDAPNLSQITNTLRRWLTQEDG